jgi:hypothetical protein
VSSTSPVAAVSSTAPVAAVSSTAPSDGEDEPELAVVAAPKPTPPPDDDADDEVVAAPVDAPVAVTASAADDEEDDVDPLAGLPLAGVDARWRAFVAGLQRQRAGVFRMARVKAIGDDVVDLGFPNGWGVDEVTRLAGDAGVVASLERAFGVRMRFTVVKEEAGGTSIHEAEEVLRRELQDKLEAHARAHPVVQKAVALFGGEVRAVRRR